MTDLGIINLADYGVDGTDNNSAAGTNSDGFDNALAACAVVADLHMEGIVWVPPGAYRIARKIEIPNGVKLLGAGPAATIILPANEFTDTVLVTNAAHDGTQEYCFLEALALIGGGDYEVALDAVLHLDSVFVNSAVRNVVISGFEKYGILCESTYQGGTNVCGPLAFENVWVARSNTAHNIVVDQVVCTWWRGLTSERAGEGKAGIYFRNTEGAANGNHIVSGFYTESDQMIPLGF